MKKYQKSFISILSSVLCIILLVSGFSLNAFAADKTDSTVTGTENEQSTVLSIDNQNRYIGMKNAYSEGYVPTVTNGYVTVVLPLISNAELKNSNLKASVSLGDTANMPFVCKNYEKTVSLEKNKVNNSNSTIEGYLVAFDFELRKNRINGSYPVTVQINSFDKKGNPVNTQFTVYVTIGDGLTPQTEGVEAQPSLVPKIMVESCQYSTVGNENADISGGSIEAGQKMQLRITLKNVSLSEDIQNLSVNVTQPENYFSVVGVSGSQYVGFLGAGKSTDIICEYQTSISAPAGQYGFQLSYDYAYGKGVATTGTGVAQIQVGQSLKMEFDSLQIADEVTVSDTVEANIHAMNLSRTTVYNVRATIQADGLSYQGTAYIGDIEAGQEGNAAVQILISALSDSDLLYGKTNGIVTYYYEDVDGNEYSIKKDFSTTIKSPFSDLNNMDTSNDKPTQWWIIMLIAIASIVAFGIYFLIGYFKRRKTNEKNS